jgi:putative ABC transport system permease protein
MSTLQKMNRQQSNPPAFADLLLYLCLSAKAYNCMRGDLTEEFHTKILPVLGARRARVWYWHQVVRSIGPALRGEIVAVRATKRKGNKMETLLRDLRFGLRMLVKTPGFTAVSLITLALGIGATTAMFSVVNGVLLRPLPYKDPDKLVLIKEKIPKISPKPLSIPAPDILSYQRENHVFEDVAGYQETEMDLTSFGSPVRIGSARISWNGFRTLGVAPLMGREFTPDEDQPNRYVTIISYSTWQKRFGHSPDVLGRTLEMDRKQYQIVGVMPPGFTFPLRPADNSGTELWVPMALTDHEKANVGDNFDYNAVARIKAGVSLRQVEADAGAIMQHIYQELPADVASEFKFYPAIIPLKEETLGQVRQPLFILLAAVVFVLLIAITNVANLMLARGNSRQRELAVRVALGASNRRVIAQLLSESVLLAVVGGLIGVACAAVGTKALVSLVPGNIPRLATAGPDTRVLAFALLISIISGIAFGAAPALFALRTDLNDSLKEGGRSGGYGKQHRILRSSFVVTQIALALMLLVGSGLLIRSFQRVLEVNPGFRPEHVISGLVSLPPTQYEKEDQVKKFFKDVAARMQEIPGAQYAGVSTDLPLRSSWQRIFTPEGYQAPPGAEANRNAHSAIAGDYLQAMGIPLLRGRFFTPEEYEKDLNVIIVSESLARRYFGDQDPIGRRVKWGVIQSNNPWMTIVGEVGDVKQGELDAETMAHTYTPISTGTLSAMNLAIRTRGDAKSATSALQSAVWSLDKQLPVTQLKTMEQVIGESTAPRRFNMILVLVFASAALLLASVGLYGVMAYSVTQRTQEIGVRMAMGAQRGDILKMVMRWGMLLTVIGIGIGVAGAFAVTRLLTDFLFGIKPSDGVTFAGVALVLAAVALLACYIPARRATKVDPMVALRAE